MVSALTITNAYLEYQPGVVERVAVGQITILFTLGYEAREIYPTCHIKSPQCGRSGIKLTHFVIQSYLTRERIAGTADFKMHMAAGGIAGRTH